MAFFCVLQAATLRVGNYEGEEVFTPFKSLLPMVDPNDFVIGGWDISGLNMAEAMERAQVRVVGYWHGKQGWGSAQADAVSAGVKADRHELSRRCSACM
jgi:hypothetical protein